MFSAYTCPLDLVYYLCGFSSLCPSQMFVCIIQQLPKREMKILYSDGVFFSSPCISLKAISLGDPGLELLYLFDDLNFLLVFISSNTYMLWWPFWLALIKRCLFSVGWYSPYVYNRFLLLVSTFLWPYVLAIFLENIIKWDLKTLLWYSLSLLEHGSPVISEIL